ncbi:hypothetical protein [Sporosarcina highlanderae]|uniref:Uncharacterized protein n=1 Tax=Sporosarcina highlanderae TaxID=3035916 RepID=A0ABT8JSP3_9BACL|nr:hypothetical protein [Sporosarcina highlanderae]MDN4607169.1 hypothetical protein [Sporosarcina highlanderae]
MTQKGFDLNHIELILKFNMDEIDYPQYFRRRDLSKNGHLSELNYIVNDNQHMLNEFLSKISVGLRCRAMKGIFKLTNRDLEVMSGFGKSAIGYFIQDNMELNKDSIVMAQRNTSLEMLNNLAIILDLPFRYLAYQCTKYQMINDFSEYNTPKIKVRNLYHLIEETLFELKNEPKKKRNIFGVRIENEFQTGENKYLNTRVDIREKFFTIEIHLENHANLNSVDLINLEGALDKSNEIYIRDAFLRDNKKLCILILTDINEFAYLLNSNLSVFKGNDKEGYLVATIITAIILGEPILIHGEYSLELSKCLARTISCTQMLTIIPELETFTLANLQSQNEYFKSMDVIKTLIIHNPHTTSALYSLPTYLKEQKWNVDGLVPNLTIITMDSIEEATAFVEKIPYSPLIDAADYMKKSINLQSLKSIIDGQMNLSPISNSVTEDSSLGIRRKFREWIENEKDEEVEISKYVMAWLHQFSSFIDSEEQLFEWSYKVFKQSLGLSGNTGVKVH